VGAQLSAEEEGRRRKLVEDLCARERLDALVVHGSSANARQAQAQVHFLTGFLGHQDTYLVLRPGGEAALFVQYFNHVPHARRVARVPVRWGGPRSIDAVAEQLTHLPPGARVGLVGQLPFGDHARFEAGLPGRVLFDATPAFVRLRLRKSDEEIAWMRRAARITDEALRSLVRAATPGVSELELQAAATAAAIRAGGQPHFLYLSSTAMERPDRMVPQQDLSKRRLQPGDAVILELSAAFEAYSGQVLRTLTIEAEMTPLYARLHAVAWETFEAVAGTIAPGVRAEAVVQAAAIVEGNGFTACDDLVHGYGGGYLPPVLRTPGTGHNPVPDFVFEENMTLVIQPNVVTLDQRAGVQVGELVRVTRSGVESLHRIPQRGLHGGEALRPDPAPPATRPPAD
jgi:Xaa-Pro dipeptidase